MANPVFKLEKVIHTRTEERQDFEGPLDLILYLLRRNKMEIADISISLICGQYLDWLNQRQQMDLEVASEFVVMASYLVYIKTRMLLSIESQETQSEVEALIQSLEERHRSEDYSRMKTVAEQLGVMGEFGRKIFVRESETEPQKIYEYSQNPEDLLVAMEELWKRVERSLPPSKAIFQDIIQREPYPVERKSEELLRKLRTRHSIKFLQLFRGSQSRSEIVAVFLAVLELCRAGTLYLVESDQEVSICQKDQENRKKEKGPEA